MTENHCLFHILTVGFHHRRGSTVELVYPAFPTQTQVPDSPSPVTLPQAWKVIPSLALPDGAHNYRTDTVYFTLPALDNLERVAFCTASYRQVDSKVLGQSIPEVTRNIIQKSLVVISKVPLFTFIGDHISRLSEALFGEAATTLSRIHRIFDELDSKLRVKLTDPVLYQDTLYFKLSVANFLRTYGRDSLVLFKLLLIERRVLFTGDSAGWIGNWILTLISLVPNLLGHGLTHCALVDDEWLMDETCFFRQISTLTPLSNSAAEFKKNEDRVYIPECDAQISQIAHGLTSIDQIVRTQSNIGLEHDTTYHPEPISNTARPLEEVIKYSETGRTDAISTPFTTDEWGFPLAVFTKSNILPLFVTLSSLDSLLAPCIDSKQEENHEAPRVHSTDRRVRAFLAGTTNPLLRTHKQLSEVIVTTLSPVTGMTNFEAESYVHNTIPFERAHQPIMCENGTSDVLFNVNAKSSSDVGRSFGLLRKSSTVVQFCSAAHQSPSNSSARMTPTPLSQALQLSRMDRVFIDSLIKLVTDWFQARTVLLNHGIPLSDLVDALCDPDGDNIAKDVLDALDPSQKTVLSRFPSDDILNSFIRQQFAGYLRALLLTADGYGDSVNDFNNSYIACLRATHTFATWQSKFDSENLLSRSKAHPNAHNRVSLFDLITTPPDESTNEAQMFHKLSSSTSDINELTSVESASSLFAQHPARRAGEFTDWDQFFVGVKRFRDLAADRGRRLMSQGAQSWMRFSNDFNNNLRLGSSTSSLMTRFSGAFKSLLNPDSANVGH